MSNLPAPAPISPAPLSDAPRAVAEPLHPANDDGPARVKKQRGRRKGSEPLNGRQPPAKTGQRPRPTKKIADAEIKDLAQGLIRNKSDLMKRVLRLLWEFTALPEERLFAICETEYAISEKLLAFRRNLSNYRTLGVLDYVPDSTVEMAVKMGLTPKAGGRLRAYTLTPLGQAVVEFILADEGRGPTPHPDEKSLGHDLLCAEVLWRFAHSWQGAGFRHSLRGPQACAVWEDADDESGRGKFVLRPDGLMVRYKEGDSEPPVVERAYVVELQNRSFAEGARKKVAQYENLAKDLTNALAGKAPVGGKESKDPVGLLDQWGLTAMPEVFIVYRDVKALRPIEKELARRGFDKLRCVYRAVLLRDALTKDPRESSRRIGVEPPPPPAPAASTQAAPAAGH